MLLIEKTKSYEGRRRKGLGVNWPIYCTEGGLVTVE